MGTEKKLRGLPGYSVKSYKDGDHDGPTAEELARDFTEMKTGVIEENDFAISTSLREWADGLVGFSFKLAASHGWRIFRPKNSLRCPPPDAALSSVKAKTNDEGKEPLAHLPWAALDELSRVQAYGHKKYGDFNNYRKGMEVTRNLSCALRHIRDYLNGVDKDHESGLNPLTHAFARLGFVLQNLHDGVAIDDRFKAPSK